MHGVRKAAFGWKNDYARKQANDGFGRDIPVSTTLYHPKSHARVVVHGDDFTFATTESEVRTIRSKSCGWYDAKVRCVFGSGKRDVREEELLGRNLRWTEEGLEYEARGSQQCGSQAGGDWTRRRRGNAEGTRED